MPVTDDEISGLKTQLESLVGKIKPLRERSAILEAQLAQAQRDYDRELGVLNAEAIRLSGRKTALRAALAGNDTHRPMPILPPDPGPTPPPPVIDPGPHPSPVPLAQREDPREARKRALWKHLYEVMDPDQPDPDPEKIQTIQAIHAMVRDDQRDVGDMLEVLAWGDVWKVRGEWETVEEQARRLDEWRTALQQRLKFWEQAVGRLEKDPRQGLLNEMQKGSQQQWLAYLKKLAGQQQTENESLRHEVTELENEWRLKQAARK
jgi:hypothetical protein